MTALIRELPGHLIERTRIANGKDGSHVDNHRAPGEFVLYWMCTALRLDENPALDVARYIAAKIDKPLLIYHALSETYQYASDRHHTFILEAAKDLQGQASDSGLSYAFHLQSSKDRRPHLIDLANCSAVVITEDMPVDPPRRFLAGLMRRCHRPILLVDTACVVPMQLVGQAYTRAFQYREATEQWYRQRVLRPWPNVSVGFKNFETQRLPFEPINFDRESIADLVACCRIDHSVGPVRDTRGGSTAGYQRWQLFKERGLNHYAKRRNDALSDGVSRMSAYLHYGMVSPFRLAREAAEANNSGAEKYLDELLIWRELAYCFCQYNRNYDGYEAIPEWARRSLEEHQSDPRPAIYDWETLARGQTEDDLWNAAQHSLLRHGELHNNLRMTWGKAFLRWTRTPQEALRLMIDLNHRYALDGRDPASYGGILWCLGQFDRPFQPPQPILGTVRDRSTQEHSKRLDSKLYWQRIHSPRTNTLRKVAIIGAGMSGAMAARTLADHGVEVTVFEKSRGAGGRMATRRMDNGTSFDHGAQYFTVRDERFHRYVMSWLQQGLIVRWPNPSLGPSQRIAIIRNGQVVSWSTEPERYIGQPSMNALCKHLLSGIPLRTETRVAKIDVVAGKLSLKCDQDQNLGTFDRLVISTPAPQTAALLHDISPLAQPVSKVSMQPCWAVMAEFCEPITDAWAGAFIHDSWISWVARKIDQKCDRAPMQINGRNDATERSSLSDYRSVSDKVVIHVQPEWTLSNWDSPVEKVVEAALAELFRATSLRPQVPTQSTAHRWRYALATNSEPKRYFDREKGIAVSGDWTHGSRVEGAFLSGMAAAGMILGSFDEQLTSSSSKQLMLFD